MNRPGRFNKTGYYLILLQDKIDENIWWYEVVYNKYAPFSTEAVLYFSSIYLDFQIIGWQYLGNKIPVLRVY